MIYHFEGHYDPMAICRIDAYVEADNIVEALYMAKQLVYEKTDEVCGSREYTRVTRIEETSIKILRPRGERL
jgi:hypothetical protein